LNVPINLGNLAKKKKILTKSLYIIVRLDEREWNPKNSFRISLKSWRNFLNAVRRLQGYKSHWYTWFSVTFTTLRRAFESFDQLGRIKFIQSRSITGNLEIFFFVYFLCKNQVWKTDPVGVLGLSKTRTSVLGSSPNRTGSTIWAWVQFLGWTMIWAPRDWLGPSTRVGLVIFGLDSVIDFFVIFDSFGPRQIWIGLILFELDCIWT